MSAIPAAAQIIINPARRVAANNTQATPTNATAMIAGHISDVSESSIAAPMPEAKETATGMASILLSRGCDCRLRGMVYGLKLVDRLSLGHTFQGQGHTIARCVDVDDAHANVLPDAYHVGRRGDELLRQLRHMDEAIIFQAYVDKDAESR